MTVKLTLYKGKGTFVNAFIRWWAGSVYSHCELVVNGVCYSSSGMDKGVRRKIINLDDGKWDVIELPWADAESVVRYFAETDHHQYGYFGLITSQLFNRGIAQDRAQFCSEWCARAVGLPNASSYSPASLGRMCEHINELTAKAQAWQMK